MKRIFFDPVDTLFFRDGSPFNREELQSNHQTLFPPSPKTLGGAIQAAYARALDWDGLGDKMSNWGEVCKHHLGTGRDPTPLSFNGPYLFNHEQPFFPVPAHIMACLPTGEKPVPQHIVSMRPGKKTYRCDIGEALLPKVPDNKVSGRKPLTGHWWMDRAGLLSVLNGDAPRLENLLDQSRLWSAEPRVGIYRNDQRVTGLQSLYAPQHIRLKDKVRLAMDVERLPGKDGKLDKSVVANPQPVGGESRSCWLSIKDNAEALIPETNLVADNNDTFYYLVLIMTPCRLTMAFGLLPNTEIAGLPGKLVSACLLKPKMLGGWETKQQGPITLAPCLTPGSVLFMQASVEQIEKAPHNWRRTPLGDWTAWGFGRFAVGQWQWEM